MKINKKLKRRIALALVLGFSFYGVAEAEEVTSHISIFGNSTSADKKIAPDYDVIAKDVVFNYIHEINDNNDYTIYGGFGHDALSNTLNFNGGEFRSQLYGGWSYRKSNYNTVNFNGGSLKDKSPFINIVSGGHAYGSKSIFYDDSNEIVAETNNNTVNIKTDLKNSGNSITGGYSAIDNLKGKITSAISNSDNNKVVIDGDANIDSLTGGYSSIIITPFSTGTSEISLQQSVSGNSVIINNGNIGRISAASVMYGISNNGTMIFTPESNIKVLNNIIEVNNGNIDNLYCNIMGRVGKTGINMTEVEASLKKMPQEVSGNKIVINNGNINYINGVDVESDNNFILKNNNITINGGIINDIFGGVVLGTSSVDGSEITNNTVNWYGGDIKGSIMGFSVYNPKNNISTTLPESYFNFYASKNNSNKTIGSLGNFENYNFYLDNTVTANTTLINLTGTADLRNSNVGVAVLGSSPLKTGDSVTLLSANSKGAIQTSDNLKNDTSHMSAENISAVYDFTLKNDGMKLTATVGSETTGTNTTDTNTGVNTNPKAENLMEGRAAEAFMTYDKLDIVDKAYQVSKHSSTPTTFLDYSYSDVTTKDNTKLRGMNMVWGAASTIGGEKDQGNTLTRGVFLEYGDNSFSSDDHYYNGSIWGSGKGKKTGIGVLLRKVMFDRHYYDAYLRAGTLNTDYSALAEGVGKIKYDNKDLYVSGHFGYGQFIQLTPNLQMDAYAKYFYNRIPGHNTTAYTNDIDPMPISFDTFTNHRLRLGSKFTWDYMDSNNYLFYVDAAIEHERSSDQSGTINGRRISKSNESGTTGVIELGYENNFGFNNAFKFTAKAQGYLGDRRGIGASANISYSF